MSIGEVLAELRTDFPDATISKLRFLEAEGLVEPQRTPSGYRKYTWDDVARLRYVLSAQRDHYLPLRVIRQQLAEDPGAAARPRPALVSVRDTPAAEPAEVRLTAARASGGAMSRAEFLERTGLAEPVLTELERYGLLVARTGGWYDADAVTIAGVVADLARYGIEPRHLRAYRAAADREVGLYAQLVAPLARQSDPAGRARAAEAARELAGLSQRLHAALIRVGLRDTLGH
ncbi:MAG TPA: MerR family transcriptional regulator [Pilimelia sp.]|nr:MerR family transcriptional regulator [Pilimelia sp.]